MGEIILFQFFIRMSCVVKQYPKPLVLASDFEIGFFVRRYPSAKRPSFVTQQLKIMFGLFKKKTEKEKLLDQYKKLQEEAYRLSHTDRKASDAKTAGAAELLKKIDALE